MLEKPCILWDRHTDKFGYGRLGNKAAHRVAYIVSGRALRKGMPLLHLCHLEDKDCRGGRGDPHRLCVEPSHLTPVIQGEQLRRNRERKSHCRNGHLFTPENIIRMNGYRACKTCSRVSHKKSHARSLMAARAQLQVVA